MSVNKAILVGRLGKDPELSYTQSGTAKCRISVATSEVYYDNNNERKETIEWHNVVVWGKQAESAGKYLAKGREVFIEGKIENRSWDDEKTGQKRYITEVKAQRVVFLGGGSKDDSGRGRRDDDDGPDRDTRQEQGQGNTQGQGGGGGNQDDDLPF